MALSLLSLSLLALPTPARWRLGWRAGPPAMSLPPEQVGPPSLEHAHELALRLSKRDDGQLLRHEFESVIRAHAEAGLVEECISWLHRMRRARKQPSLECYALVVAALSAAGRRREAARWLRRVVQPEVSQLLMQRNSNSTGAAPTLAQFNEAMIAYGAAGQPHEVMEIMRKMVRGLGSAELGTQTERRKKELELEQPVLSHSTANGAPLPGTDSGRTSSGRGWTRSGGARGGAADGMPSAGTRGVAPDVVSFNSLIAAHANAGSPERARAWIDRMRGWGIAPDACSYTTAIAGFARAGQPDRAKEVRERWIV